LRKIVAGAVVAVLLGACSSSSTGATQTGDVFLDKVEAVCRDAGAKIRKIDRGSASATGDLRMIIADASDSLDGLRPPSEISKDYSRYSSAVDDEVSTLNRIVAAASSGDTATERSALANLANASVASDKLVNGLGAIRCRGLIPADALTGGSLATGDTGVTTSGSTDSTTPTAASATTTSSTAPTPVTLASPTITTSLPNASTVPPTSSSPTDASATTVPFVVPPNAVDLGRHVYIPIPDGWTHTPRTGGQDTLVSPDGNTKLGIQVLARSVGEAPSALMQEYADTFTPSLPAVNFTSTVRYTLSGPVPAYEYGTYYSSYSASAADGVGTHGGLYVFQRADGLSAVYDVFGPTNVMGVSDATFQAFLSSFEAAPLLGPAGNLQAFSFFRVTTAVPSVAVTSVLGFTPAPGFTRSTDPGGGARVSSSDYVFTVKELTAQPGADAAVQAAEAVLGAEYTGTTFGSLNARDPYQGLTHIGVSWNGTYTAGKAVSGAFDIFWDPKTMNAISINRDWYTTADGSEPEVAQEMFMYGGVLDDISFGVPNP
jgi:hypothetical protein